MASLADLYHRRIHLPVRPCTSTSRLQTTFSVRSAPVHDSSRTPYPSSPSLYSEPVLMLDVADVGIFKDTLLPTLGKINRTTGKKVIDKLRILLGTCHTQLWPGQIDRCLGDQGRLSSCVPYLQSLVECRVPTCVAHGSSGEICPTESREQCSNDG
jgi:hypothetical protein